MKRDHYPIATPDEIGRLTDQQIVDDGDRWPRFVIHEHYATTHHFDLRLERDGTLWSWAVPKGMPTDPQRNRLAVRVENHDLDHIDFVDPTPVPDSTSGAIRKSIWDSGTYDVVKFETRKIVVDLRGDRLDHRYAIFQTSKNDSKNWMLHLMEK